MIETSLSMPGSRVRVPEVPYLLGAVMGLLAIWRARRAWRVDLRRMDDHLLADIGISRADAEAEIAKPFWRH